MVDLIKGIAIIMIVNVHLIGGPFFLIGDTYHVIAFFFVSGIVHGLRETWNTYSLSDFIRRKAVRLLYPYLTLSLCYVLFHAVLCFIRAGSSSDVIVGSLINTVTFKGIGTLWFLPVLFLGEFFFFSLKKTKINDWCISLLGLLAIVFSSYLNAKGYCGLKWYGDSSLYGLLVNTPLTLFLSGCISAFFIEIGFVVHKYLPDIILNGIRNKTQAIWASFLCIISLVVDYLTIDLYAGDLHKLNIGNPVFYCISSFTGLSFVFTISLLIDRFSRQLRRFLKFIGEKSLIIMTTHTEYYINTIAFLLVSNVFISLGLSHSNKIVSGFSLLIIILIEFLVISVVEHTPLKYLYLFPKRVKGNKKV